MTLDESVHGMRLRVIERAQVLGNVSAVCRELGISRTLFYRCANGWNALASRVSIPGGSAPERGGRWRPRRRWNGWYSGSPSAPRPEGAAASRPTWPALGRSAWPPAVQRLLRRVGSATRRARLTVLEQQAARTAGLLTERTRERLWRARH